MKTLNRTLASVSIAAVLSSTACGSGSSGSPAGTSIAPAVPVTSTTGSTATGTGTATLTIRFPAHLGKAKPAQTSASARTPAYINPNGGSLVVSAKGTILTDPANMPNLYFTLGAQNLTTGVSQVPMSLPAGSYNSGDLQIVEYTGNNGTGTPLAYGYNASYTDTSGGYQNGSFTISPGGAASPVVTMAMNTTGIAITTDPINGSGAQVLPSGSPVNLCESNGTTVYVFPVDALNNFLLPGAPTGGGYTGGDPNGGITPVPTASLNYQSPSNPPARLVSSLVGGGAYVIQAPGGSALIDANFYAQNPLSNLYPYPPFSYSSYVYGNVNIGPGNC